MVDSEDVVRWIVYRCREEGHPVTEALAAYIAHTTVSNATGKFYVEYGIRTEADAKTLVDLAVNKLSLQGDAAVETLKM